VFATPVTGRCHEALARHAHALIGISPFNSYFSAGRICDLVRWGLAEFDRVHLFVPDLPAAYTLRAAGYGAKHAARKARRQANYLGNKIRSALGAAGLDRAEIDEAVLDWQRLEGLDAYQLRYAACRARFQSDMDFRAGCLDSARWVLQRRNGGGALSERALHLAAQYFLTEIPFFADTVGVLEQPASLFCYHQCPQFVRDLLDGRYGGIVSPNQGFAVVRKLAPEVPAPTRD
jgi:cyclo(L-tyrosyl-L-tyrosyl) synthase